MKGGRGVLLCESLGSVRVDEGLWNALSIAASGSPATLSVVVYAGSGAVGILDWRSFIPLLSLKGEKALDMPLISAVMRIPPAVRLDEGLLGVIRALLEYEADAVLAGDDCYVTLKSVISMARREWASSTERVEAKPGNYVVMSPDSTVLEAVRYMNKYGYPLVVVEEEGPVVFGVDGISRAILSSGRAFLSEPIGEYSRPLPSIDEGKATLGSVLGVMDSTGSYHGVGILSGGGLYSIAYSHVVLEEVYGAAREGASCRRLGARV